MESGIDYNVKLGKAIVGLLLYSGLSNTYTAYLWTGEKAYWSVFSSGLENPETAKYCFGNAIPAECVKWLVLEPRTT